MTSAAKSLTTLQMLLPVPAKVAAHEGEVKLEAQVEPPAPGEALHLTRAEWNFGDGSAPVEEEPRRRTAGRSPAPAESAAPQLQPLRHRRIDHVQSQGGRRRLHRKSRRQDVLQGLAERPVTVTENAKEIEEAKKKEEEAKKKEEEQRKKEEEERNPGGAPPTRIRRRRPRRHRAEVSRASSRAWRADR